MSDKPILCLDFDGVIHSYERGWGDGTIYGELTPGFAEWAAEAKKRFDLRVMSSRDPNQIAEWLDARDQRLEVTLTKPPAFLTIDDRCVRFDGRWDVLSLDPDKLLSYRPWTMWAK